MLRYLVMAAVVLLCNSAIAGSFSVTPVRVEIKPPRRAASIEVQNTGDKPAQIQVHRYRWTGFVDGKDQLQSTEDIIATPPIFVLAPQQKQVVRILQFGASDPARELSYRLVLEETALHDPPPNTIQTLLRISLPLFITPKGAKSAVVWSGRQEGQRWWLEAQNEGNAHAFINTVRTTNDQALNVKGYVLPGERRRFAVDARLDQVLVTLRDAAEVPVPVSAAQ